MTTTNKWLAKLTKDFGEVAENLPSPSKDVIKFPSPSLNWALGNGGLTEGKIACFYGPESAGKSLLSQLLMIEIQKKDPEALVVIFDAEYSFNRDWFSKLGGDLSRTIVRQTNDPVLIFDFIYTEMYQMLQDGCPIKGIMIDSIKSICYPGDIKDESTKITMGGGGAKYLGPTLKRILPPIKEFNITCAFIQQVYEELDQYKAMNDPYKIPDGRALKHASDYMLEVTKIETKDNKIEEGKTLVNKTKKAVKGHTVQVRLKKNRVGAPAKIARFKLHYERGIIDTAEEVYNLALSLDVIFHPISTNTGRPNNSSWQFRHYPEIKGQDNFKEWAVTTPGIIDEMYDACCSADEDKVQVGVGIVPVTEMLDLNIGDL
jgi:recombination protein RecA